MDKYIYRGKLLRVVDGDTIDAMIDHIVGKCLDQFDIDHDLFTRWGSK